VFENVQLELNQFGLIIYNANVKQLVDVRGHEYFSYLGQKTQQEAANQAKIDVSEAKMKGEMGAKERDGHTRQNAAKVNAETKIYEKQREGESQKQEVKVSTEVRIYENQRAAEVAQANADLAVKKASWEKDTKLKQVEAEKAVALRDAELQMEVEKKNAMCETEKLKADILSKAIVDYEKKVQYEEALTLSVAQGLGLLLFNTFSFFFLFFLYFRGFPDVIAIYIYGHRIALNCVISL
jgi:flotillin